MEETQNAHSKDEAEAAFYEKGTKLLARLKLTPAAMA
jgi:hypothetical protein